MSELPDAPPPKAPTTTLLYRVPFFDTDAMRVVHHANYVRYLELARIEFLDEHDVPYREYVAQDRHFAVTDVEVRYKRGARFDEQLEVTTWVVRVRGASLRMGYVIRSGGELIATAATGHAMVDETGRPRPIPKERRAHLDGLAAPW